MVCGGRVNDIQQALMRADLKLLPALLVYVWTAVDSEPLKPRW